MARQNASGSALALNRSGSQSGPLATTSNNASAANINAGGIADKARRTRGIHLPGITNNTRSLFIFAEDNFIRKYAKAIIEWG